MNKKELKLVADLLYMASAEFCNHGCNDLPEEFWKGWSKEEKQGLVKQYHEYNGDLEDYNPEYLELQDWALMDLLRDKILNNIKE